MGAFFSKDGTLRCQGAFRQLGFLHIDLSPPLQALPKALDHLIFWEKAGRWGWLPGNHQVNVFLGTVGAGN